jgi:hypothetical protein
MTTCIWFRSWDSVSPLVTIKECSLWDSVRERCERNEDCPEPRPWPVHVVVKEEERRKP